MINSNVRIVQIPQDHL